MGCFMDIHEAAAKLDGVCFGDERGKLPLYRSMAEAGLMAVFAGDDRSIFIKGVVEGEIQDRRVIHLYEEGLLQGGPNSDDCPYLTQIKARAIEVTAKHRSKPDDGQPHWLIECPIEHATFETTTPDSENPYCRGMVIHAANIPGFTSAVGCHN
jgi:hypothetical protein